MPAVADKTDREGIMKMEQTGRLTLPTDADVVAETLRLKNLLGADALRDCDGTEMPKELLTDPELLGGLGLGLESRLTTKVSTLSGGQRQALTLLMATLKRPKLLLLDEHTAALDPKTAAKVMELTDRIVREGQLTTLMITHNMRDAIQYGNRLIMLHDGHVILDIAGEEKKKLTVPDLLEQFTKASGDEFANDRAILS